MSSDVTEQTSRDWEFQEFNKWFENWHQSNWDRTRSFYVVFNFSASDLLLIFQAIIKVPDKLYRESHYLKDEKLGLFGLQMKAWLQGTPGWVLRPGSDFRLCPWHVALSDQSSIIHFCLLLYGTTTHETVDKGFFWNPLTQIRSDTKDALMLVVGRSNHFILALKLYL